MFQLIIRVLSLTLALLLVIKPPISVAANQEAPKAVQTQSSAETAAPKNPSAADQSTATESSENARRHELTAKYGAEIAEAILAGTVIIGMTMAQVLLVRGAPTRKEVIPPDMELWHYPASEVAFQNGKVSYVTSQRNSEPRPTPQPSSQSPRAGQRLSCASGGNESVNIPTIKAGDTYVIESIHSNNPALSNVTRRQVVSTNNGIITVSSINLKSKLGKERVNEFMSEWNLLRTRNADGSGMDYSPPLRYFDFPLFPGKSWQQQSVERNIKTGKTKEFILSGLVGCWEDISVPAGTFRAIVITLQTEMIDPSQGTRIRSTDVSWYAPDVHRSIKTVSTSQDLQENQGNQLIQLLEYNLR